MGENARKRLAAALIAADDNEPAVIAQTAISDEAAHDAALAILAADPQLEADIALGAALNSDKAERVLADALDGAGDEIYGAAIDWIAGYRPKLEAHANLARAILAALREGLRER